MPLKDLNAQVWSPERLVAASNAAGVALWAWNVDTGEIRMDERGYGLWDVPRNGPLTFETLSLHVYPPDRDRVRSVIEATRTRPGPYEIEFRVLRGKEVCWIAARGLGADEGIVGRFMFGIFMDVTKRKQAEEAREMLAGEMSHRVKNLFAIASSLTSIAARSAATTKEMARDLLQRLATLGRAHDLLRKDAGGVGDKDAFLGDLFAVFLSPYDNKGVVGERIHLSFPDMRVGESSTTALALIVHELATNSVKYGALSAASGSLDVSCTEVDDDLAIVWRERGGPPVSAPDGPGGFGSNLIARSITGQFSGSITFDWLRDGVAITIRVSKARLVN